MRNVLSGSGVSSFQVLACESGSVRTFRYTVRFLSVPPAPRSGWFSHIILNETKTVTCGKHPLPVKHDQIVRIASGFLVASSFFHIFCYLRPARPGSIVWHIEKREILGAHITCKLVGQFTWSTPLICLLCGFSWSLILTIHSAAITY